MASSSTSTNPCLQAALAYAKFGWTVFPAELPSKHPHKAAKYSRSGNRWGATNDSKQITRDFEKWPDAAVCIPTGIENDFFVVEADTPEGHDVDGIANLQTLINGREWPETRTVRSPSGSLHYYFMYPYAGRVRTRTGKIAIVPGVDVLGDGGMVVAPPSVKPSAGEYVLEKRAEIKHAPQWLLDLVTKEEKRKHSTADDDFEVNVDIVVEALNAMTNDNVDEDLWYKLMAAAWRGSAGHDEAYRAFVRWSARSHKHDPRRTRERWQSFNSRPPRDIGPGTLYAHANKTAPGWRDAMIARDLADLARQYAADVAAAKAKGGRDDRA